MTPAPAHAPSDPAAGLGAFDVAASFHRSLAKRRRRRSAADRQRRVRAATREVEFALGEWERVTGACAEPERSRLQALSRAECQTRAARIATGLRAAALWCGWR